MLETSEQTLNPTPDMTGRMLGYPAVPLNYDDEEELTPEKRAEIFGHYEESLRSLGEGEIVRGTVLAVDDKEVLVDVGFKSEEIGRAHV